jgi:hypothetical protein
MISMLKVQVQVAIAAALAPAALRVGDTRFANSARTRYGVAALGSEAGGPA